MGLFNNPMRNFLHGLMDYQYYEMPYRGRHMTGALCAFIHCSPIILVGRFLQPVTFIRGGVVGQVMELIP